MIALTGEVKTDMIHKTTLVTGKSLYPRKYVRNTVKMRVAVTASSGAKRIVFHCRDSRFNLGSGTWAS